MILLISPASNRSSLSSVFSSSDVILFAHHLANGSTTVSTDTPIRDSRPVNLGQWGKVHSCLSLRSWMHWYRIPFGALVVLFPCREIHLTTKSREERKCPNLRQFEIPTSCAYENRKSLKKSSWVYGTTSWQPISQVLGLNYGTPITFHCHGLSRHDILIVPTMSISSANVLTRT